MSAGGRAGPPRHVPTLTEVVDPPSLPRAGRGAAEGPDDDTLRRLAEDTAVPPASASPPTNAAPHGARPGAALEAPPAAIDEAALRERLAGELLRQVEDALAARLERRVEEVLAPTLARITEALVLETREQLAELLRELVAEAVAAERARHEPH